MPYLNSASGLSSTRTAGSELPPIVDLADAVDLRQCLLHDWSRRHRKSDRASSVSEVIARIAIGASAGLTLR